MSQAKKLLCIASLLGLSSFATAATSSGTLTVQLTVQNSCSIGTSSGSDANPSLGWTIDFGTKSVGDNLQNSSKSVNLLGSGGVTMTCTAGSSYSVALDGGLHSSGGSRRMTLNGSTDSSAAAVPYGLYKDGGTGNPWVAGTAYSSPASGGAVTLPVYATISSSVTAPTAGVYNDKVGVTISW